jgi:hypothetical protein
MNKDILKPTKEHVLECSIGPIERLLLSAPSSLIGLLVLLFTAQLFAATPLRFEVTLARSLPSNGYSGRLLIALSRKERPEPRLTVGEAALEAPYVFGCDVTNLAFGAVASVGQNAASFPINSLAELPEGDYYAQAVLDSSHDLRAVNASGNLYGDVRKTQVAKSNAIIHLELNRAVPEEPMPEDADLVKFIKLQSKLLSKFHGHPMFLRAGIILPRDYAAETDRHYPLWVRIGGYGTRYSSVRGMMNEKSDFRKTWMADDTPRMVMLQLDGAGPNGDPLQVNSPNNGPYGDAVVQELIPLVESRFRCIGRPKARTLSGSSTGGWAALALQIFYPDFFNGVWCACPDPVDFRAFELINIYQDENAYVNKYGYDRPSERAVNGELCLTLRREIQIENVTGADDNWTRSPGDWCAWNAAFGPRAADGHPAALWDPKTGVIDHKVAEEWKKRDLRLVLERDWKTLGPKLQGKLRISVGDADNYYLNNAVHLLDAFLSKADPPYQGRILYGLGKGHGWSDVSLPTMLKEMAAANR